MCSIPSTYALEHRHAGEFWIFNENHHLIQCNLNCVTRHVKQPTLQVAKCMVFGRIYNYNITAFALHCIWHIVKHCIFFFCLINSSLFMINIFRFGGFFYCEYALRVEFYSSTILPHRPLSKQTSRIQRRARKRATSWTGPVD